MDRGRCGWTVCFLSTRDFNWAFDSAPRHHSVGTLRRAAGEPYFLWFLVLWLTERTFRAPLRRQAGDFFSARHGITRGVPQGGALSPPLRLLRSAGAVAGERRAR